MSPASVPVLPAGDGDVCADQAIRMAWRACPSIRVSGCKFSGGEMITGTGRASGECPTLSVEPPFEPELVAGSNDCFAPCSVSSPGDRGRQQPLHSRRRSRLRGWRLRVDLRQSQNGQKRSLKLKGSEGQIFERSMANIRLSASVEADSCCGNQTKCVVTLA